MKSKLNPVLSEEEFSAMSQQSSTSTDQGRALGHAAQAGDNVLSLRISQIDICTVVSKLFLHASSTRVDCTQRLVIETTTKRSIRTEDI